VRHKHIPVDITMFIHMGRHHLGQTDKGLLEIKDDANRQMVYEDAIKAIKFLHIIVEGTVSIFNESIRRVSIKGMCLAVRESVNRCGF